MDLRSSNAVRMILWLCTITYVTVTPLTETRLKRFDQLRAENMTGENSALQFLRRFNCFSACQHLNDCLSGDYGKMISGLGRTEVDFVHMSAVLLDHVLTFGPECHRTEAVCDRLDRCAVRYLATSERENGSATDGTRPANELRPLEAVLQQVQLMYRPGVEGECFSAFDLQQEAFKGSDPGAIDLISALFLRLYNGECIDTGDSIDFVGRIFGYLNKNSTESLTDTDLGKLMSDMGIVRHGDTHLHDDHDSHEEKHEHDHKEDDGQNHQEDNGNDHQNDGDSLNEPYNFHMDHIHERKKRAALPHDHGDSFRHLDPSSDKPNSTNDCWSARHLIEHFDHDKTGNINMKEFYYLCPALIQQRIRGSCINKNEVPERDILQVYGYGTLAVFLISFCSVLGVVLMPIQKSSMYQYIMTCFIALAFGTLTGDALLHLIPESVGLHSHGGEETGDHHNHDEGVSPYFWKFLAVLGSIYGLFVFEGLAAIALHNHGDKSNNHGHSHIPSIDLVQMTRKGKDVKAISNETLDSSVSGPTSLNGDVPTPEHQHSPMSETLPPKMCCGMTTLAFVIIIGDAIHNVADGLTIGAAFSSSIKGGMSSALAIFFHELPHEFGDFVILLSTGFSFKKALLWNFVASLTAFIGLYIGIEVGENEEARQWILTVAAGMFLYIAVGDMLPELKNHKNNNAIISFVVQNVGVLIGISCMVLLSVFEGKIKL